MVRNEKKLSPKRTALMTVFCLFMAIIALGTLRFYSSNLEYMLGSINKKIERYASKEVELKQTLSRLVSPASIYSQCKDMLGMNKVKNVEVLRVDNEHLVEAPNPESAKGWRSSVLSFFGFSLH